VNPPPAISNDIPQGAPSRTRIHFNPELIPLILIVVFVVIQMYPFTFGGQALMTDTWKSIHPWARGVDVNDNQASIYDTVLEYGPWFEYSQECLKDGRIPHWNPWQFCGAPLYANRLIPFFFPPFILAELLAHPHTIIAWFQLFNFILSGWGMYFLLRRWNIGRPVATLSSMLWLTCGIHFLPFPLWTLGVTGFPWLLMALDRFLDKPGLKPLTLAGFITGLILMVGYPVLVVHLSYFTAIYFFSRWWSVRRVGPKRLHWTIPILSLLAVYLIGAGISSVSNLPAFNYSKETVRQVEGFHDMAFEREKRLLLTPPEEAGHDPVAARFGERADILLPINGRGTKRAWQFGGILVYLLALLGIFSSRPRSKLLGILLLVFSIPVWIPEVYLILIDILPAWGVTILLPIEVINLIAYLLAAFGIDLIVSGFTDDHKLQLWTRILFALLSIGAIAFTVAFLRNAPVINLPYLHEVQIPNLLAHSPWHVFYLVAISILALSAAAIIFIRGGHQWLRWLFALAVLAFSLVTFWYLQPAYSNKSYNPETPFTTWADQNMGDLSGSDGNRLARWAILPIPFNPHKRDKSPFTPNLHLNYGIRDVGGYDSLVPRRYIEYCTYLMGEEMFMDYRALVAFRAPSLMYHPRFRALGVRWILSQGELPEEARQDCTLVWDDRFDGDREGSDAQDDFIQVWEINDPLPRAFLTRKVAYASDPDDNPLVQAANWAAQGENIVVVENPAGNNRSLAFPGSIDDPGGLVLDGSEVVFEIDEPERLLINVHAPDDSMLILRDGWFPEWDAFIDGAPTEIFPADAAFRAIEIPSGDHTVEFVYNPRSYKTGLLITVLTLLLSLALYSFSGGRRRYDKSTASNL